MVDELLLFVSVDNLAREDILVICFKARRPSLVLRYHFSPEASPYPSGKFGVRKTLAKGLFLMNATFSVAVYILLMLTVFWSYSS